MVDRAQRSVLLPNEERKVGDPEECARVGGNHVQSRCDVLPHPVECGIADVLGPSDEQTELTFLEGESPNGGFAQELRCRSLYSARCTLEAYEPARSRRLRDRFDLVDLLAGESGATRNSDTTHPSACFQGSGRDAESGPTKDLR